MNKKLCVRGLLPSVVRGEATHGWMIRGINAKNIKMIITQLLFCSVVLIQTHLTLSTVIQSILHKEWKDWLAQPKNNINWFQFGCILHKGIQFISGHAWAACWSRVYQQLSEHLWHSPDWKETSTCISFCKICTSLFFYPQLAMKAWMEENSDKGSFQWLSRLDQGFQVSELIRTSIPSGLLSSSVWISNQTPLIYVAVCLDKIILRL